jgi:hypothetical protein
MTLLTAKPIQTNTSFSVENLCSLMIHHQLRKTDIIMKLLIPTVNTKDIPWTSSFLQEHLPAVLYSTCFNEEKLPFSVEVCRTEIGHLFEHILLEYLCQEKLLKGYDEAVFSGHTKWNWKRDPWGMFHITIKMQSTDIDIFPTALEKSINLLKMMISPESRSAYPFMQPQFTNKPTRHPRLSAE